MEIVQMHPRSEHAKNTRIAEVGTVYVTRESRSHDANVYEGGFLPRDACE